MTSAFRGTLRADIIRQIELEEEARTLGVRRYQSRQLPWKVEAGTVEEEANLPPGRRLLKVLIEPTVAAIKSFTEAACSGKAGRRHAAVDFILLSDPHELAYLTARCLVNATASGTTLQNTAVSVANAIIENLEYAAFQSVNKIGYKGFMRSQEKRGYSRQRRSAVKKLFANEGCRIDMAANERVTIGTKCIEMLVEATEMFEIDRSPRPKGFVYVVRPSEVLQKWLDEQHARCAVLDPVNLPMVIRPRRWRSPSYGGYLTHRPGNKLVKQRNRAYHEELRSVNLDHVYEAVNHVQDTPWRINARVLSVMEEIWDSGGEIGGLPRKEPEDVPSKPHDIDTNEDAKNEWKRRAAEVYARNGELVSSRIAMHQKLWVARKFSEEPRTFFPHELDFRGRVYPIPSQGPTPQGDDSSKSLLEFADGFPIGEKGSVWLTIHIANLFGVDKVSFQDRLNWVWNNSDALLACALDPFENRFWTEADSPFSALAACFDWKGFIDEGYEYVSHLPIALDGSCSGLQHFSAMLRDRIGGESVNLTTSDKPQDVYMRVANRAQVINDDRAARPKLLPVDDESAKETKSREDYNLTIEAAQAWVGKISRPIAKRPTMTYCYSATRFGMHGMILQTLNEADKDRSEPYLKDFDNYKAAMWMSHVIWDAISEVVVAASEAMEWLRAVAKVAAEADLPLWWTTPQGLPILQEYKSMSGQRVKAHWAGQRVDLMLTVETNKLDRRAQCNGVAPNFVHSLDASHLMAVARRCKEKGINHIAVIHDSFGTHAAHTDLMADILRETFIEQYRPDVLGQFYQQIKEQLPDEIAERLPAPPAFGDLDLNEVIGSSYIFA